MSDQRAAEGTSVVTGEPRSAGADLAEAAVEKLGFTDVGFAPAYLHIDGAWRDHRSFAVVTDELGPGGLRARLSHQHQASRARHTDQPAAP